MEVLEYGGKEKFTNIMDGEEPNKEAVLGEADITNIAHQQNNYPPGNSLGLMTREEKLKHIVTARLVHGAFSTGEELIKMFDRLTSYYKPCVKLIFFILILTTVLQRSSEMMKGVED